MSEEAKRDQQEDASAQAAFTRRERARAKRLWILKLVLLGLIGVMLVPFVVPTATRIAAGLRYPYQLDSEEGFVLWQAWRLRHGHNIFRKLDSPPYVAATYAPLYPLLSAATLWGEKPSFFGGRLLSAVALLAICVFMGLMIHGETRQAPAAILGPLLFLNSYDVYDWLPYYRVDFTALALGMAGLWLLTRGGAQVRWRFRAACACFVLMVYTRQVELAPFLAAWLYLLVAKRPLGWRLLRNVAAWGLGIAAMLTLATKGQFLVHNVYYNANPFDPWQLKRVLVGHVEDGRRVGGHFWIFHRFFTVAALVCLVWYLLERLIPRSEWLPAARTKDGPQSAKDAESQNNGSPGHDPQDAPPEHDPQDAPPGHDPKSKIQNPKSKIATSGWGDTGLFAAYAVVASIGILGVGKIGAATNYLIEPKAAWALFMAVVLGKTLRPVDATGRVFGLRPVFFPVAFVLVLHAVEFLCSSTLFVVALPYLGDREATGPLARLVQTKTVRRYLGSRPPVLLAARNPGPADRINGDRLVAILRQTPPPVFCEHPIYAMHSGHAVYIQPFIMKELANEGKWDQMPVVQALRSAQFSLVVTTEDVTRDGFFFHYTDAMVRGIRQGYRKREELGAGAAGRPLFTHFLYTPRR